MRVKLVLMFSIMVIFTSCDNGVSTTTTKTASNLKKISGYQIYKTNCRLCHGLDGRMGLNGAKIIPDSKLTLEERIMHITNGKGAMQPYKGVLSDEQIKAVAAYTMTLGKQD